MIMSRNIHKPSCKDHACSPFVLGSSRERVIGYLSHEQTENIPATNREQTVNVIRSSLIKHGSPTDENKQ
jgi:hypothetical protein